jgi:quercetin dioxygenase-like cupin family protein
LSGAGLAEFPGKEARRYTAQIAPGAMTPWRRHPGHFFTHVAEGTGLVQEDGKPEIQLEPGATL